MKRWRAMGFANLFKSISNILGIVTFGIGAGVGGVDFSSVTKSGTDIGTDIGIGLGGTLVDIGVSEIETPIQEKRIQREDEDTKDESEALATLMNLDQTLGDVQCEMADEKAERNKEKSELIADKSNFGKVDSKMSDITGKTEKIEEQSNELQLSMDETDSSAEMHDEAGMSAVGKGEVKALEDDVTKAEDSVLNEKEPGVKPDIKEKKGFFARIKAAAKSAGKKFKRGFKKLFMRLFSVFSRVKALIQKAKAKITDMVLSALGVKENVLAAHEDIKEQKETEIPGAIENIDTEQKSIAGIEEKLGELD